MERKWLFGIGALLGVAVSGGIGVLVGMSLPRTHQAMPATPTPSGYADLLETEIRGLSAETIDGYRTGKGLGMALPAELNGYPGPRHVLEMVDELELTDDQHQKIQSLFDAMQSDVIPIGKEILEAEIELESAFRARTISESELKSQVEKITALEARLRYRHLRTHLALMKILTSQQVNQYNVLRGYAASDHNGGDQHP